MGFARSQSVTAERWHRRYWGFDPAAKVVSAGKGGADTGMQWVWREDHRSEECWQ